MPVVIRGISPFFLLLLGATAGGAVLAAVGTGAVLVAGIVLVVLGGWAVSLCLHEFAHAFVAYRGGDATVRARGYLTLDIRRYTNVALTFVLPVLFLLLGGIPLPGGAVLVNHGAIRSRAARSLVSFAGPAVNLVLGLALVLTVAAVPMAVGLAAAAKVSPWAPLVLLVVLLGLPGASAVLFGIGDVLFGLIGGNARLANAGYAQLLFWR